MAFFASSHLDIPHNALKRLLALAQLLPIHFSENTNWRCAYDD
jgi:hypothetical protein